MLQHFKATVAHRCTAMGATVFPATTAVGYRYGAGRIPMPQTNDPYIYIVVDGEMRLHTPSGIMDYVSGQYSASAIDTPLWATATTGAAGRDFLAMSVATTLNDVIEVVLALDGDLPQRILDGSLSERDMALSDAGVVHAALELACVRGSSPQTSFLAKHAVQELVFHALCGSNGASFLRGMVGMRHIAEIYEMNGWIKENFRKRFTVDELAERFAMSPSSLHAKFKGAVGMGPLQCQKRLRLTEARRIMLDEERTVTEAAFEVGYESPSQFARDYRKMFGVSPKEDALRFRG